MADASESLAQNAIQVASAANSQSEASSSMAATIEQMTVSVNHVVGSRDQTRNAAHSIRERDK